MGPTSHPQVVGLITARGGSKEVPRKNLREVAGKPLIAWTIAVALESGLDDLYVSTDDDEIEASARSHGISKILKRGPDLAADDTPHSAVIADSVAKLEGSGTVPLHVVLLQPTSPLRTSEDVVQATNIALENHADRVVSVSRVVHHHPYLVKTIDDRGRLRDFVEPQPDLRRQDLPPVYAPNGAVYVFSHAAAREGGGSGGSYAYVMPPDRSLDVDTEFDLLLADLLLRRRLE